MRQLICPNMCRYYKPGKKEDPGCGGLEWIQARPELRGAVEALAHQPPELLYGLDNNDARLLAICQVCEFRIDGCDFRDPGVAPDECEPCGGLRAVAGLLAAGQELDLP